MSVMPRAYPLLTCRARDDLQGIGFAHNHLTSNEARRIANGIARLPEFIMQRKDFHERGTGQYRWKKSRPYHVALEDSYVRARDAGEPYHCRRAHRVPEIRATCGAHKAGEQRRLDPDTAVDDAFAEVLTSPSAFQHCAEPRRLPLSYLSLIEHLELSLCLPQYR